ncbi:MAG TPA: sulfatase-like hydrolase/transferase [Planctomycetota bacterium]|nr:sulfatase-like hydrolase/transferase [Planctomycetota bacterium]
MPDLPHIVIFNPDQFRYDGLGHSGNPCAVTPNLDRLAAAEGVSFTNAFCQNPVCTPSRCSFMTGWYPHVRGHRSMFHMLHADEPNLLRTLRQHGYFVWWGGKNDLIPGDSPEAMAECCDVKYVPPVKPLPMGGGWPDASRRAGPSAPDYYSFHVGRLDKGAEPVYRDSDWLNVEGAVELIRSRPQDRPLAIYLPLTYPHPTYAVEEPWYGMIDRARVPARIPTPPGWEGKPAMLRGIWERQKLQGWSEERWRELRATYYGMCARIDHQFGMVVEALRAAGIYDRTAIFFFSDHGDYTGDYGLVEKNQNTFEDALVRVPFLIKPPKGVPVSPGRREALVELVDFPATVEALAGIRPEHTHFGRSLLPLLADPRGPGRDAVFCEGGRVHGERHCMELESASSQDPAGPYWPRVNLQSSEGPEHGKAVMCRTRDFKYVRRLYESDELYDLRGDPAELVNRVADPALAGVLARLRERMLTFFLDTGDAVPHRTDRR